MSDNPTSLLTSHKKVALKILADAEAYQTLIKHTVTDYLQCDIDFTQHSVELGKSELLWFNDLGFNVAGSEHITKEGYLIAVGPLENGFKKEFCIPVTLQPEVIKSAFYSNDDFYFSRIEQTIYRQSVVFVYKVYRKSEVKSVNLSVLNNTLPAEVSTLTDIVPISSEAFLDVTPNAFDGRPYSYTVASSDIEYIYRLMSEIAGPVHAARGFHMIDEIGIELGHYFFTVYSINLTADDMRNLIK